MACWKSTVYSVSQAKIQRNWTDLSLCKEGFYYVINIKIKWTVCQEDGIVYETKEEVNLSVH